MKKVNLTLTEKQLHIIEDAIDLFIRVGIGQLGIVLEKLEFLFPEQMKEQRSYDLKREFTDKMKEKIFDFAAGANFGISSPHVCDNVKIGYDLQKVIQKHIAVENNHDKYSVWHDGPMLHLGSEPIAEIENS